jgi:hypothetical protein
VTQFLVCLRVLPFSELVPKNSSTSKLSKPRPFDPVLSLFSPSLLKGLRPDLILSVTRFNETHLLIYFFIHNPFSHKFLKLLLNVQSILSYELSNLVLYYTLTLKTLLIIKKKIPYLVSPARAKNRSILLQSNSILPFPTHPAHT